MTKVVDNCGASLTRDTVKFATADLPLKREDLIWKMGPAQLLTVVEIAGPVTLIGGCWDRESIEKACDKQRFDTMDSIEIQRDYSMPLDEILLCKKDGSEVI